MTQDRWHIPTCDEELADVFLEEVGELLQNIDTHLKTWTARPEDQQSLTEIRRSFHTLKGSGRMVKALDLSEVAWKVERMLNQALGGTVQVSEPMVKVVAAVRAQIPKMVDAFKRRRSLAGNHDIETLMRLADTLAAGKTSTPAPALRSVPTVASERPVKSQEINARVERCMQRADEALHRSEMALQQARRVSALIETPQKTTGRPETGAEVARIAELVSRLSKEVSDLRLQSEKTQRESALRQGEMNQLVEQRVRARLAPNMDRLRGEIAQEMEENRRTDAASHRFGWLAVILSVLVGGLIATALILSIPYLG
jgi:chemotaxis protein histidine kinase CheA